MGKLLLPLRTLMFAGILGLGSGCGPTQSTKMIVDANAELAAAQTAQADEFAPFEYVAAEEYLHKAREEQSYSDYELAVTYAKKAYDCARVARAIAVASTRSTVGASDVSVKERANRCQAGPKRSQPMLHPAEEPAAKLVVPARGRPAARPQSAPPPPTPEPKDPDVTEPAAKEPVDPPLPPGDEEVSEEGGAQDLDPAPEGASGDE